MRKMPISHLADINIRLRLISDPIFVDLRILICYVFLLSFEAAESFDRNLCIFYNTYRITLWWIDLEVADFTYCFTELVGWSSPRSCTKDCKIPWKGLSKE
jgi:hypothetical protein